MKSIINLLAVVIACSRLYAIDQIKIDEFKSKLTTAITSKDIKAINDLFYTNGISQYQLDSAIYSYEYNISNYTFKSIDLKEFSDLKNDKFFNQAALSSMLEGEKMNCHLYVPNLTPVLVCTVNFISKKGMGGTGNVAPVGVAPDGSLKFTLEKCSN